jgi:hypothetical protein
MSTVTATILVGSAHQNHTGIIPTHQLLLTENSRPAWSLFDMHSGNRRSVWVPTVEDMLEDGLLMVGLLVVQDEELIAAARGFRGGYSDRVEMYDDIDESERRRLHELCRGLGPITKLVVTVLEGSSLARQLAVLRRYQFGVEVCPSVYQRESSSWSEAVQERGSLPVAGQNA